LRAVDEGAVPLAP